MTHEIPLTQQEKIAAFKSATSSLMHWYAAQLKQGMTDAQLENALQRVLGIMGGKGGPDRISVSYQGAGLKIWAGWSSPNTVTDKPLFQGNTTVAMAREVFNIPDPTNPQQSFF